MVWMVVGSGYMKLEIAGENVVVRVNVMRHLPNKILLGARFLREAQADLNWRGG